MGERSIFIDKNTSFEGSITATEVIVEGSIKGDVIASEKVLIKNGGVVDGDIITEKILFEEGGEHNGLIRLGQPIKEDIAFEKPPQLSQSISDDEDEQKEQVKDSAKSSATKKQNSRRLW